MTDTRKVLLIGGFGDGRVLNIMHGDRITLARERYELEMDSGPQTAQISLPETEYKIHTIAANDGAIFHIGLPEDITPADAIEALFQCYSLRAQQK